MRGDGWDCGDQVPDTQVTVTDESCHSGDLTEPVEEMGSDSEDFLSSGTSFLWRETT